MVTRSVGTTIATGTVIRIVTITTNEDFLADRRWSRIGSTPQMILQERGVSQHPSTQTASLQRGGPPAARASEGGGVFAWPFIKGSATGTSLLIRSVFTSTFCLGRGLMSV